MTHLNKFIQPHTEGLNGEWPKRFGKKDGTQTFCMKPHMKWKDAIRGRRGRGEGGGGEITQLVSEIWNLPHGHQNSCCHARFCQEPDELQEAIVLILNLEHIQDYLVRMPIGAEWTTTGWLHSESSGFYHVQPIRQSARFVSETTKCILIKLFIVWPQWKFSHKFSSGPHWSNIIP
jgi:hypothetical protein